MIEWSYDRYERRYWVYVDRPLWWEVPAWAARLLHPYDDLEARECISRRLVHTDRAVGVVERWFKERLESGVYEEGQT